MENTTAKSWPSTNVSRGTTRIKITFGRSLWFQIFEKGEPAGQGPDIRFVPEHIRHDVEMRILSAELNGTPRIG